MGTSSSWFLMQQHTCAGKKEKGGKDCSFVSAMMVSRPRRGVVTAQMRPVLLSVALPSMLGWKVLQVLRKYQKRKVTGQKHRLPAIWNPIICVTEGKLPQEMAQIPDLWFCQKVLHNRQSSWLTVARLSLSDKATSTAVSPQHLPVKCSHLKLSDLRPESLHHNDARKREVHLNNNNYQH